MPTQGGSKPVRPTWSGRAQHSLRTAGHSASPIVTVRGTYIPDEACVGRIGLCACVERRHIVVGSKFNKSRSCVRVRVWSLAL